MNTKPTYLEILTIQIGAIVVSLLLFALFLAINGKQPVVVFADMYQGAFGTSFSRQNALARAAPLMLTALCTALPAQLGLVVIGNEGALLLGALGAAIVPMLLTEYLPSIVVVGLMFIVGAGFGAIWIALAGLLRQMRGVNETISSLLLFYVGLSVFLYCVEGPFRDPASLNKPSTPAIAEFLMLSNIPWIGVHWGLLYGILACLFCFVLMSKTIFGFAARIAGGNMHTALALGLPINKLVIVTCALGGAFAGLAGAVEVSAIHGSANASIYAGLGFAGILVAFVARHNPLVIIFVAILLGGLEASGGVLQRRHDLSDATIDVFKGMLFLVILASEALIGIGLLNKLSKLRGVRV